LETAPLLRLLGLRSRFSTVNVSFFLLLLLKGVSNEKSALDFCDLCTIVIFSNCFVFLCLFNVILRFFGIFWDLKKIVPVFSE